MKIKRLIAGGLTAVAAGATIIGGALAATTFDQGMGQFVSVSGGALTSPVIVVGAGVDTTDVLGAADIAASLVSNYAVTQVAVPGGGATSGVANGVLIKSDLNKPYIGTGGNLSAVKSVLTETDLPDLLAKTTFTDMNSTTSTITEKIVPNSAVYPTFGIPSGATDPVLYLPVTMTTTPYNLTVTFIGGLDVSAVDTTYGIKLFGKDYTFGNTHTVLDLQLYSSAGAQVVDLSGAGDEKTATVGSQTFTIKLNGWDTGGTKAYVSVNGVSYTWNEAGTYTVNAVKFYVQSVDVIYTGAQEASGMAKIFVGTDKLRLVNGQAIEKNDVTKNSLVFISNSTASKVNSITFQVYPDDDVYVQEGVAFTDPVFGSFKTVLSGMTPGITDSSRDLIKITADSSNVKLSFKNKDGMQYSNIPVFFGNSSTEPIYGKVNNAYSFHVRECNISTGTLLAGTNITKGDYFAVTSGDYSYILKYASYNYDNSDSSKTYVTFTDLATNSNYKVYPSSEDLTIGSSTFDVNIWGDKTVCVSLDGGSTYSGAYVNITTGALAKIDLTNPATTGSMYIDEVPLYTLTGANDPARTKFNVSATYSSSSGLRFSMTPNPTQVGTNNEWKTMTAYGSYVDVTGDNNGKNAVNLYNAGNRPAYANIAMGTNPVITTTAGATGGTYNAAVPVTNPIAKFPSEVTQTASLDKDLVLVGGPCANTLVQSLLNTAWNVTNSCDAWLADPALKDNGKGLIQIVESVFGSGHKALIVAGTSAADTRAIIANKVIKPTVFTGLGAVSQFKGDVA